MDALATCEPTAKAKTHVNRGPPKSAPKGRSVGNCEEEEQELSKIVPSGIADLESFKVLSQHGDVTEDDADADESSGKSTVVHAVRNS